ncbi:MAG: nicotinamide riboside transporter PnuC [Rhizomicrobium sp.]|nr:nicotinamide riboside transporter PnuC [Rhizomicrobium sp.]
MSWMECIAAGLGIANVWLVVRRSVWNYPFGLAMVILYGFVFYQAKLYSDTILQGYYVVVQLYGWWVWTRDRDASGHIQPQALSFAGRIIAAGLALLGAAGTGWYFATYTNAAAPWMDAFIAATSVTAQYLQSVRKIESWLLWIAVDVVAIGVYFWKGLYPTTGLYGVFLLLSVVGFLSWRRQLHSTGRTV